MSSLAIRSGGLMVEVSALRRSLREEESPDRYGAIERTIARLNLEAGLTHRALVMTQTLERVTHEEDVALVALRRAGPILSPAAGSTRQLTGDGYQIVLRGSYLHVLRVLLDLSGAPLVLNVTSITVERIRGTTEKNGQVQASLDLAVFALRLRDGRA